MLVAALEFPLRFGDAAYAFGVVDQLLARAPGLDLALLPEAALTGYVSPRGDFDLSRFAEPIGGATTLALAELSRRHRVAIAGPLIEAAEGAFYNALILFDRAGELVGH